MVDEITRPVVSADAVIRAYADLEGLTAEECSNLGIAPPQCGVLQRVLDSRDDCPNRGITQSQCDVLQGVRDSGHEWGIIIQSERNQLNQAGFSDVFIRGLAGDDGRNALAQRARWFADRISPSSPGQPSFSIQERIRMIRELSYRRSAAGEAVPTLIGTLIGMLRDENELIRDESSDALSRIGSAAVPALTEVLRDRNAEVRYRAARAFARMGASQYDSAIPALIRLLGDQDARVRWSAANAVGDVGRVAIQGFIGEVVPLLIRLLQDQDAQVREEGASALGNLRIYTPAIIAALERAWIGDGEFRVRRAAGEALDQVRLFGRSP